MRVIVSLLLLLFLTGFISDNALHLPPDCGTYAYETWTPASATFPAVGGTYLDPIFGETLTRLTNIYPATAGSGLQFSNNGLWNADSTAYVHDSPTAGFDIINPATGATIRSNPAFSSSVAISSDPLDANGYYYVSGANLLKYSISGNSSSTVKTFGGTLGDLGQTVDWIDNTGDIFLLNIGGFFRIWKKSTDTLYTGSITVPTGTNGVPPGWAGISPDAAFLIVSLNPQHYSYAINHGTTTLSTTAVEFWNAGGDHGDVMTASDGTTYLFTENNSYGAAALKGVYRVKVTNDATASPFAAQLSMPGNQLLVSLPSMTAGLASSHFGCAATGTYQDWCWVSLEDPGDTLGSPGPWYVYKQETLMIHLLPPFEVRRLLHHRSRPIHTPGTGGFCRTPRVGPNRAGTKMMIASPFSATDSADCGYSDLYRWDAP